MTRTLAAFLGLGIVLVSPGCTCWSDFSAVGNGGSGGTGGDGGTVVVCTPGEERKCYGGPVETEGIGACKAGTQTCEVDGSGFGPCAGEVLPEPEDCATPEDDDCDGMAPQCGGSVLWAKRFGDTEDDRLEGIAASGEDVLLTGYVSGPVDFGSVAPAEVGGADAFVAKLAADGSPVWVQRFGDPAGALPGDQGGTTIAAASGGDIVVAGTFSGTVDYGGGELTSDGDSDIFILKLQADGSHVWSRRVGGSFFESATALATDAMGNVLIVGSFLGTVDFGTAALTSKGGNDVYVLKLGPDGEPLWAQSFGDADTQKAWDVALDPWGNVLVAGYFGGTVSFGGDTLVADVETDGFVLKLDPDGAHVWSKALSGPGAQTAFGIAADQEGNVLVAGSFETALEIDGSMSEGLGPRDAFVLKLGPDGTVMWKKSYGDANGSDPAAASAITTNKAGDVLVTGSFKGVVDFGHGPLPGVGFDVFVIRVAPDGSLVWDARHGTSGEQYPSAIAVDATDHVLLGGWFSNAITFGDDQLISAGQADVFVAKLHP